MSENVSASTALNRQHGNGFLVSSSHGEFVVSVMPKASDFNINVCIVHIRENQIRRPTHEEQRPYDTQDTSIGHLSLRLSKPKPSFTVQTPDGVIYTVTSKINETDSRFVRFTVESSDETDEVSTALVSGEDFKEYDNVLRRCRDSRLSLQASPEK